MYLAYDFHNKYIYTSCFTGLHLFLAAVLGRSVYVWNDRNSDATVLGSDRRRNDALPLFLSFLPNLLPLRYISDSNLQVCCEYGTHRGSTRAGTEKQTGSEWTYQSSDHEEAPRHHHSNLVDSARSEIQSYCRCTWDTRPSSCTTRIQFDQLYVSSDVCKLCLYSLLVHSTPRILKHSKYSIFIKRRRQLSLTCDKK